MTDGLGAASEEPLSLEFSCVPLLPVTDVRIVTKKSHCPEGYELIDRSIGGRAVHLGALSTIHSLLGVNCRYMCISRDMRHAQAGCMLVTSILLIKDSSPVPEEHRVVAKTCDSDERALPKGQLCLQHEGRHLSRKALYDVCLVMTSQGERVPLGYQICGELSGVTLAARLSHYQSPVPELPPLPPKPHQENSSDDRGDAYAKREFSPVVTKDTDNALQLQEEHRRRKPEQGPLATVRREGHDSSGESPPVVAKDTGNALRLQEHRCRKPKQRPLTTARREGRDSSGDSPLPNIHPVSKQFENVLRFVSRPWLNDKGAGPYESKEPKFLSLTELEPLESLPVREKLYSHTSGRTAEKLPFTLVGHYDVHRLLAEVDQIQRIPIVDVDEKYHYSFKEEIRAQKGRSHRKSKHHRKHHSSDHSRRKRSSRQDDEQHLKR